jgi:hypothetical protein
MPSDKIKVGLLIDSFFVPAWIYETIKRITESDYATISLVIKKQSELPAKHQQRKLYSGFNFLAYNLYRKLENKYIKLNPNAFSQKNISDLVNNTPILNIQPVKKGNFDCIQEVDLQLINSYQLDTCIKLGFQNLKGSVLTIPKFGVWDFGENLINHKATLTGVRELMQGCCVIAVSLRLLFGEGEEGYILYQSFSAINISINKNQNIACWKAVSFIPRKLKELHEKKDNCFIEKIREKQYQISTNKGSGNAPNNIRFISYLLKRYFKWGKKKAWNLFNVEQWALLYFNKKDEFPLSIANYDELVPPKDRFWADPCVFRQNEKYFIFFEEYIFKKKKAHISVAELDKTGKLSNLQIVLNKPYHLSYPFVFNAGTDIFMIPETSENKTIEIYKCVSFPDKWEFQMNLMENIFAVDTTIHYHENKFWLFVNIKENKGASAWDELFLFCSNELLTTKWKAHSKNPVISDVRQARPAGRIFTHNGKLYRPSQDCSCTYGYATNINEIIILDEKEYKEKKITTIFPEWNKKVKAVHTYSHTDGLTVVDARIKRRKL